MDRRYSFLMMFSVCDDGFWSGFNSSSLSNLQADIILMHVLFNVFVSSRLDTIRGTPQGNKGHNYHFIGILLAAGGGMVVHRMGLVFDRILYCKIYISEEEQEFLLVGEKFITNSSTTPCWLRFLIIVSDAMVLLGISCSIDFGFTVTKNKALSNYRGLFHYTILCNFFKGLD